MSPIMIRDDFNTLSKATENLLFGPSLLTWLGLDTNFLLKHHPSSYVFSERNTKEMSYYSRDTSACFTGPVTPSKGTRNFPPTILNILTNKQKRQKVAFFWEHGHFGSCTICSLDHSLCKLAPWRRMLLWISFTEAFCGKNKMSSFKCLSLFGSFLRWIAHSQYRQVI